MPPVSPPRTVAPFGGLAYDGCETSQPPQSMIPNAYRALDHGLGDTADMLRDSVRTFVEDRVAPLADEIDRSNVFPRQLWPEMGALGLHGVTVEQEYGGSGLGYLEHVVAME